MTTEDTTELKLKMERVAAEVIERQTKADRARTAEAVLIKRRNLCWVLSPISGGIALGLSILQWTGIWVPPVGAIAWFVAGMGLSFLGAVVLLLTIHHRRKTDPATVGQLVAEMQSNRILISDAQKANEEGRAVVRAALELSTGQILKLLADIERQRQSDLIRVGDAARKLIDGVSDQLEAGVAKLDERLDKLAELTPLALNEAARQACAAAVQDLRAALAEAIKTATSDEVDSAAVVDLEDVRLLKRIDDRLKAKTADPE